MVLSVLGVLCGGELLPSVPTVPAFPALPARPAYPLFPENRRQRRVRPLVADSPRATLPGGNINRSSTLPIANRDEWWQLWR